jgi:hypothetical protein
VVHQTFVRGRLAFDRTTGFSKQGHFVAV